MVSMTTEHWTESDKIAFLKKQWQFNNFMYSTKNAHTANILLGYVFFILNSFCTAKYNKNNFNLYYLSKIISQIKF